MRRPPIAGRSLAAVDGPGPLGIAGWSWRTSVRALPSFPTNPPLPSAPTPCERDSLGVVCPSTVAVASEEDGRTLRSSPGLPLLGVLGRLALPLPLPARFPRLVLDLEPH